MVGAAEREEVIMRDGETEGVERGVAGQEAEAEVDDSRLFLQCIV